MGLRGGVCLIGAGLIGSGLIFSFCTLPGTGILATFFFTATGNLTFSFSFCFNFNFSGVFFSDLTLCTFGISRYKWSESALPDELLDVELSELSDDELRDPLLSLELLKLVLRLFLMPGLSFFRPRSSGSFPATGLAAASLAPAGLGGLAPDGNALIPGAGAAATGVVRFFSGLFILRFKATELLGGSLALNSGGRAGPVFA